MKVRYRYQGRFVSESKAKQLSTLKHAAGKIRSERIRSGGTDVTRSSKGYVPRDQMRPGVKRTARPPAPPRKAPPRPSAPAAVVAPPTAVPPERVRPAPVPPPRRRERPRPAPVPPPSRRHEEEIEEEEEEAAGEAFDAALEEFRTWGETMREAERDERQDAWRDFSERRDQLERAFHDIDSPTEEQSDQYDEAVEDYDDLAAMTPEAVDWEDEVLWGYDYVEGESDDLFDVADIDDEDKYKGK